MNSLYSVCVYVYSKQNQLWMEGVEFYKGCPYNKAAPYEYGIYSIKQREMFKSMNGNGVQNVPKGECHFFLLFFLFFNFEMFDFNLQKMQTFKSPN